MITTQKALRNEFWYQHPQYKRVAGWKQNNYHTDIRVAWCDFIVTLYRDGTISKGLGERATL